MKAYLLVASWRFEQLSCPGKLTSCYVCGEEALHLGLLFTCTSDAQIKAHSAPEVSEPDARGVSAETKVRELLNDAIKRIQKAEEFECSIDLDDLTTGLANLAKTIG